MDSSFGKGVRVPVFEIELGAELECWRKFIKRFEIAVIGAGLKAKDSDNSTNSGSSKKGKKQDRSAETQHAEVHFDLEQRKAALLLNSMGDLGMNIFDTWDFQVDTMQYEDLKTAFEEHFAEKENIVATRHRFLSLQQKQEETLDRFIERVEASGKTGRFGKLQDAMVIQVVIKGMNNDKIRKELLVEDKLDLQKVKSVCNRHESAMAASKIISKPVPTPEIDQVSERTTTTADSVDRVGSFRGGYTGGRGRGRGRGGRGGCFTCGSPNHIARNCNSRSDNANKKQRCFNCGREGHFARECPHQNNDRQEVRPKTGKVNAVDGTYSDSGESL
jgi:hypothetical protein